MAVSRVRNVSNSNSNSNSKPDRRRSPCRAHRRFGLSPLTWSILSPIASPALLAPTTCHRGSDRSTDVLLSLHEPDIGHGDADIGPLAHNARKLAALSGSGRTRGSTPPRGKRRNLGSGIPARPCADPGWAAG